MSDTKSEGICGKQNEDFHVIGEHASVIDGVNPWRKTKASELAIDEPPSLPIVLCSGLFSFHTGPFYYFRAIPKYLVKQGCKIIMARVPMTASIEERASKIKEQIEKIIVSLDTPQGAKFRTEEFNRIRKVHLVAHSLGGLDARYYVSCLGGSERVYSLTTIATPHRGTSAADWALRGPIRVLRFEKLAKLFNMDTSAFRQLTSDYLAEFNLRVLDHPNVKYYSYAGVVDQKKMSSLSPMRIIVKKLDEYEGPNDGCVSVDSAKWGKFKGAFELDHIELMNWNFRKNVRYLYRDIIVTLATSERKKLFIKDSGEPEIKKEV